MRNQIHGAAALLIAALTLGSCAAALQGYPNRVADTKTELAALNPFMNKDAIDRYQDPTLSDVAKKLIRDEYVNARISAIDIHFGEFEMALFQEGVGTGIATDWIKLALGGAGALYAGASQALSAAAAGIEGAKASFDKQAFFANTITTLFAAMDANRRTVQVRIRKGLDQSVANYPLTQAFADLEDYYLAGTIPGALIGINADSGAKGEKAQNQLNELTTFKFVQDTAGDKLQVFWMPDGITPDPNNTAALKAEMAKHGLETGPGRVANFITGAPFADLRVIVAKDLGL